MESGRDAMLVVRAELCDRLERVKCLSARSGAEEAAARVAAIRLYAAAYGLDPVVRLAEALERAMADPGRALVPLYLDRMSDAIGCTRLDAGAGEALIASISVRLG
jgi:hypothetical protein